MPMAAVVSLAISSRKGFWVCISSLVRRRKPLACSYMGRKGRNAKGFASKPGAARPLRRRRALPFPEIDPVIFQIPGFTLGDLQIGPFPIRWYALAYVAGILIGWRYVVGIVRNPKLWERRGPPATDVQIDDLVLWITLGVIVGGRLGHVVFYTPDIIFTDPMEIVRVWNGGMSFHGGVLGVAAAMIAFSVRNKLDLFRLADLVAAAQPIGQFFGRIANFINGELWGRPTEVPWGMVFPHDPMGVPRHPSQLYEAALEGVLVFLILRWSTHGKPKLLNRRGVVA